MSNNKKQFGLIGKFANSKTIFILVHKLIRSQDFFENNLENNLFYKEQFNNFFLIGKVTQDYIMLKFEDILEKCLIIEDENGVVFLSPVVDLLTHS